MDVRTLILLAVSIVCVVNLALLMRVLARLRATDHLHDADAHGGGVPLALGGFAPVFNALSPAGKSISSQRLSGRAVGYLFVSPNCGSCHRVFDLLPTVGPAARRAGVELVLVTDVGPDRTKSFLAEIENENGRRVTHPVLAAPPTRTTMIADYNPTGVIPYFVLVDPDGQVAARGHVGGADWTEVAEGWLAGSEASHATAA